MDWLRTSPASEGVCSVAEPMKTIPPTVTTTHANASSQLNEAYQGRSTVRSSSRCETGPAQRVKASRRTGVEAPGMSRLNDVGGRHGFGPIERAAGEPPFHAEWEARVFALNRLLMLRGIYNLD